MNEALEKLDGEEHGASILKEKTEKAEAMISELQAKGEELEENISKVSIFSLRKLLLTGYKFYLVALRNLNFKRYISTYER